MTLIKSISGIRGTIGGRKGQSLSPIDVVLYTSAYAEMLKKELLKKDLKIVIGRDARVSGEMISNLVSSTLVAMGCEVIDLGLSTTPTVEVAVVGEEAHGGIILTASHNPFQWNALKLLNSKGEFISAKQGEQIIHLAQEEHFSYADAGDLGKVIQNNGWILLHIEQILKLDTVAVEDVKSANFKIVVDAVDSTGGISIPPLLERLGCEVIPLNCEPTGHFSHNPEPLPQNITALLSAVKENNADLGIVVDPDVDRLAFVTEEGLYFGEEYTLVAVTDYLLSKTPGNTVSNLSSSRALRDVTRSAGQTYHASAVGEVNVVEKMKEVNAVIGGEGNGGIIYPELHYGRDALVGIALFLSGLASKKCKASEWLNQLPKYYMSKNKISLTPDLDVDHILAAMAVKYEKEEISTIDGVKIDFEDGWVHLRKSNTEPIIRVYSEGNSTEKADAFASDIMQEIADIAGISV
ncbi:MAG: phosphoglucosamine mutase [Bacteroidota bacterium]